MSPSWLTSLTLQQQSQQSSDFSFVQSSLIQDRLIDEETVVVPRTIRWVAALARSPALCRAYGRSHHCLGSLGACKAARGSEEEVPDCQSLRDISTNSNASKWMELSLSVRTLRKCIFAKSEGFSPKSKSTWGHLVCKRDNPEWMKKKWKYYARLGLHGLREHNPF